MTTVARSAGGGMLQAWKSFWFEPQQMYTLGLVRIGMGALTVLWALWLLPMRYGLLAADGVTPTQPSVSYTWGIFAVFNSDTAMLVGVVVLVLAGIALLVGWHSRLAAVIVFILIMSFERRAPASLTGGDALVRIEALFLALSPCGAALSLDQRRRTGAFWSAETRPSWPIRLFQVQLSLIYLSAVRSKLAGETWLDGTAVSYALRLADMQRVRLPEAFVTNAMAMNVLTWGAIAIELAVGILVWVPRLRPWVLGAGVLLHTMIEVHIQIGIFSYATMVMYLSWVSPETLRLLPERLGHAWEAGRGGPTTGTPSEAARSSGPKKRPEP